jgi:hypothetical protein
MIIDQPGKNQSLHPPGAKRARSDKAKVNRAQSANSNRRYAKPLPSHDQCHTINITQSMPQNQSSSNCSKVF